MNYPGKELENFEKATIWRKYIYFQIKKYIKFRILEVGAGIGSFTKNYINDEDEIVLTETDDSNLRYLKKRFQDKKIDIKKNFIVDIKETYNTIMYLNVLEHIEDDKKEIEDALKKLNSNGYLIILVPAHNNLYSKFDKAVGHFRRYEMKFFENLQLNNSKITQLYFLDCMGYFLYFLNKIFFKEEVYPSKMKILIWDKFFTPITFFLDKILGYKFGKNIMCIIKKN